MNLSESPNISRVYTQSIYLCTTPFNGFTKEGRAGNQLKRLYKLYTRGLRIV